MRFNLYVQTLLTTRLESIMLQNLLIMLFGISPIFCIKMIMMGIKCESRGQLQYKSFVKCVKIDVSASICSNFKLLCSCNTPPVPSNFELHCLLKDLFRFVHSVFSYSLFGIQNRSALDFMFVLAEIS